MERKSFLDQEAPAGYIAGLGRGATGFNSSLNPAKLSAGSFAPDDSDREDDEKFLDADGDNTDGLLRDPIHPDVEDDDADKVYEQLEERLKRKKAKKRKLNPTDSGSDETQKKVKAFEITTEESINEISTQFKDLKQNLATITEEDWLNLPESGDFTKSNKRQREIEQQQRRFYAVPDSVLNGNEQRQESPELTDLKTISSARDKLLEIQLDNETGQNNSIEAGEYLKKLTEDEKPTLELADIGAPTITNNIGDIKKTRLALASMRKSNPYKPQGWIASARLEEHASRLHVARRLIQEGCEMCPRSQDIWLENVRMNQNDIPLCKSIIAESIKYNSNSVQLWLKAVDLEREVVAKKRVLRKSLEYIPTSIELWESLVGLETDNSRKVKILAKATELIPTSIDLWLKYATLMSEFDFEESKQILNTARKSVNPDDTFLVWIYGAKLEEKISENEIKVDKIIRRCLMNQNFKVGFYELLRQSVISENEGLKLTCRSIILNAIETQGGADISELKQNAQDAYDNGNFEVARSLLLGLTRKDPTNLDIWNQYISIEKELGDYEELFLVYELAIDNNPHNIELYKRYALDKMGLTGELSSFKMIIDQGVAVNPNNEELQLTLIDQFIRSGTIDDTVLTVFENLRGGKQCSKAVYYKNVTILRRLQKFKEALQIISDGLNIYLDCFQLILQKFQIYKDDLKDCDGALLALEEGTKACGKCDLLWIELSRIYEVEKKIVIKARSVLDQGIALNPNSDNLIREKLLLEKRSGNQSQYTLLLSQGIKKFPKSGILWAEYISIEGHAKGMSSSKRKNLYVDALQSTGDNEIVLLTVAKNLWKEGRIAKSKAFFDKALSTPEGKLNGDVYIWYLGFMRKHGDPHEIQEIVELFKINKPKYGEVWCKLVKSIDNLSADHVLLLQKEAEKIVQ